MRRTSLLAFPLLLANQVYKVIYAYEFGVHVNWAVWANGPFEFNVQGVRAVKACPIPLPLPNVFDSGWTAAEHNFQGNPGACGADSNDYGISVVVKVRVIRPVMVKASQDFYGHGEIHIPFP